MPLTLLFDGNYLLHRNMSSPELAQLSTNGMLTGGVFGCLRSIHAVLNSYRPTSAYIIFDGGISVRRRKLYPEYKGDRYRDPTDPFYKEPDAEKMEFLDSFRKQRRMLQRLLPIMGIRSIRVRGWEADDVIYALTRILKPYINVISDDKDMLQLVREGVNVFRPMAGQLITEANFVEELEYSKLWFGVYRAIMGDKSDNISKVPGVGKVTLEWLFRAIGPDYTDEYPFNRFLEFCCESTDNKVLGIVEHSYILDRNYQLMQFSFEDTTFLEMELKDMIEAESVFVDLSRVYDILQKLQMNKILKDFHSFVVPFQRLS